MPIPPYALLKQRGRDVLELTERLQRALRPGLPHLERDGGRSSLALAGSLRALEAQPMPSWALDELSAKAARLGLLFTLARQRGAIDEERELEGIAACEDLCELVRRVFASSLPASARGRSETGALSRDASRPS